MGNSSSSGTKNKVSDTNSPENDGRKRNERVRSISFAGSVNGDEQMMGSILRRKKVSS
jgi:hypothetical protein